MATKLDLILFGATGFTGKLCIKHLVDTYCNDKYSFKFGLAARNLDKLKCVLASFRDIDRDKYFESIECDSFDDKQIESMISKTKVVITTVGPYSVYGETLVRLCCQNGVDYIDLTGEFHWVKQMINKYQNDAMKSKARIVNIAGELASLSDCAVYAAIHKLKTDETSKDANYEITSMLEAPAQCSESGGSSASMLNMTKQGAFDKYYDPTFPYHLCPDDHSYGNTQPRMHSILPKWNDEIQRYEMRVVLAGEIERMVFCRSNHLMDYYYGKQPIIYETIAVFKSKYYIIALLLGILYFVLPFLTIKLSFLKGLTVKLMEWSFPEPGEGPTMDTMLAANWKQYVFVQSVKDKSKKMRVEAKIYGDYMYYNTAKVLVEQGIIFVIERQHNKLADDTKYGFVTPAVAFGDKLINRLNDLKEFDIQFH